MSFNYHCFNNADREHCSYCDNSGKVVLDVEHDEAKPFVCPFNQEALKLMGENMSGCITGKMSSDQIHKERRKRSHKDFKNNVLPTISDPDVRKHHLNKLGKKS